MLQSCDLNTWSCITFRYRYLWNRQHECSIMYHIKRWARSCCIFFETWLASFKPLSNRLLQIRLSNRTSTITTPWKTYTTAVSIIKTLNQKHTSITLMDVCHHLFLQNALPFILSTQPGNYVQLMLSRWWNDVICSHGAMTRTSIYGTIQIRRFTSSHRGKITPVLLLVLCSW